MSIRPASHLANASDFGGLAFAERKHAAWYGRRAYPAFSSSDPV